MALGNVLTWTGMQFGDSSGNPVAGGKVFFYLTGTSTKTDTYSDAARTIPNTNPVILDSSGRADIFLADVVYDVVLATAAASDPPSGGQIIADCLGLYQPSSANTAASIDISATAGENLAAGDSVYLSDGSGAKTAGRWYKTDADFTYASSASKKSGFAVSAISVGATGLVRTNGIVTGLAGLAAGTIYYASATAGAITSVAPANALQVGVADSTTSLIIPGSIPDASTTVSGIVNITAQAFAGVKTFTSPVLTTPTVTGGTFTTPSLNAPAFTAMPTGIGAFLFSRSTANFTKNNNTTLGDVTGMSFAVGANETWAFRLTFREVTAVAAGWKYTFTGPAAATAVWFGGARGAAAANAVTNFGTTFTQNGTANDEYETIGGLLRNGANAGTVQLQAAQNAADATNSVIYSDAYVMAWRVA